MLAKWRRLVSETTAAADFQAGSELSADQITLLPQPTLCLYGVRSPYLESGRRLAETLGHARLLTVEDAGHFHVLVQPERFRREVSEFLALPQRTARRGAPVKRAPCLNVSAASP
jgi:pimeloyl-ACP methyl ester carboxylesterase